MKSEHDTISWFDLLFLDEKYDKGLLYIMVLLHGLNRDERESALNRLAVPERTRSLIQQGFQASARILRNLIPGNPVMTYHLLSECDIEAMLFSMASLQDNDKKKAISHFLIELRTTKPLIKGSDLMALDIPPGPLYTRIFTEVLNEKLMKRLPSKEDEITFVKKKLPELMRETLK